MRNLSPAYGPYLVRGERDDCHGFPVERRELDLKPFDAVFKHDRPNVAALEAVFPEVRLQHYLIEFVNHACVLDIGNAVKNGGAASRRIGAQPRIATRAIVDCIKMCHTSGTFVCGGNSARLTTNP